MIAHPDWSAFIVGVGERAVVPVGAASAMLHIETQATVEIVVSSNWLICRFIIIFRGDCSIGTLRNAMCGMPHDMCVVPFSSI